MVATCYCVMEGRSGFCGMDGYCEICPHVLPPVGDEPAFPRNRSTSYQIGGDHYKNHAVQPIDYIMANKLDFCEGNVVKYVSRWRYKNGLEDLKKAKQYIEFLIEREEEK